MNSTLDGNINLNQSNLDFYEISPCIELIVKIGYFSISVVSIAGNLLIICAVVRSKRMHNVTNYFITNLAIVDIIISVFSTPFQVTLKHIQTL